MSDAELVLIMSWASFLTILVMGFFLLYPSKKKCNCIGVGKGNILARKVSELYCPEHGDPKLLKEKKENK